MKKVLLHLGYPKCGSTTIREFLKQIQSQEFLFFDDSINLFYEEYQDIKKEILFLDDNDFNKKRDHYLLFFKKKLRANNAISDETFLYPTNYKIVDFYRSTKRFYDIFKDLNCEINILINIRDPKELHISYFTEMYHRIIQHTKVIDTFDKYFENTNHKIIKHIFDTFNFYKIVKQVTMINKSIKENINFHLLPIEDIDMNGKKILFELFSFNPQAEPYKSSKIIKFNISKKNKKGEYFRRYDWACFFLKYDPYYKFVPYRIQKILKNYEIFNYIFYLKIVKSKLDKEKIDYINQLYCEDLKKVEKIFNLDLSKYNYYEN